MKLFRLAYIFGVLAIGMPVLVTLILVGFMVSCVTALREHYTFKEFKELCAAGLYGLECGLRVIGHWIEYGNGSYNKGEPN